MQNTGKKKRTWTRVLKFKKFTLTHQNDILILKWFNLVQENNARIFKCQWINLYLIILLSKTRSVKSYTKSSDRLKNVDIKQEPTTLKTCDNWEVNSHLLQSQSPIFNNVYLLDVYPEVSSFGDSPSRGAVLTQPLYKDFFFTECKPSTCHWKVFLYILLGSFINSTPL